MYGRIDRRFRHPGEAAACAWLEARGQRLLRHNYHTGFGEIDLVTFDADGLHFVEVKTWSGEPHDEPLVHPLETFTAAKRKRMRDAALRFTTELAALLRGGADEAGAYAQIAGLTATAGRLAEHNLSFDLVWVKNAGADKATYSCEYFPSLF